MLMLCKKAVDVKDREEIQTGDIDETSKVFEGRRHLRTPSEFMVADHLGGEVVWVNEARKHVKPYAKTDDANDHDGVSDLADDLRRDEESCKVVRQRRKKLVFLEDDFDPPSFGSEPGRAASGHATFA